MISYNRLVKPMCAVSRSAAILTLGCKLNTADSEAMARRLRTAGWQVTDRLAPSDAIIVNSCTVTATADRKSRALLNQARRLAPDATIVFTGCGVETTVPGAANADLVFDQPQQSALTDHLIDLLPTPATAADVDVDVDERPRLRTRAFIAAQEGCNDVCAFCVIPRTRGRERSKTVEAVVAEAQAREAEGALELVITGTQLGSYGRDRGKRDLAALVRALLHETTAPRVRISSVQPQDLTPELIDLWQDERLCRHFHLALQSGSDTVLRRMRRRYGTDEYIGAVCDLRAAIRGVAITTDVIVGFPGETEAEFAETLLFCREANFAAMHVFPYSDRPGTTGEKLPRKVGAAVKKDRVRRLIEIGDAMTTDFRAHHIGAEATVLWETRKESHWEGLTDTYVRVRALDSGTDLHNRLTRVRLTALTEDGLLGEVLP